ncbi:hypothetical protein [Pseudomonas juntendi]|uniref:hypothetical protein n=1 Tax=Pseudomonas juntendi TaxID=2666183 RepID=UPI00320888F1
MANILTHAARHAEAELHAAGIEVGHANLQEVLAALLGYHTYRALKHEEDDQELEHHLSDAEFIVLNQELGECRAAELFELPGEVLPKCIAALEQCLSTQVLPSVDAYLERHGMNAVFAALTNNPQKGVHLGPDWSTRYKLSPDQRFSFHEPIWKARRSWQVHVEVSLQSIAPDAELQEIIVLLIHAKAGRSGLVLRGVKPVEDITAVLEVTRVDQLVQRDDGSDVRPWVALVLHTPSGAILGSAISLANDLGPLEVNALADALRSTRHVCTDESSECLPYHISKLQIDHSLRSKGLIRMAQIAGVDVTYRTRPMAGRLAERILQKITTLGMDMRQVGYSRKSEPDVMTLAAFTEHLQKYCDILRRLTSNPHAGHNVGNVLVEPK